VHDSYLLLTPVLTFVVVALVGFVGCNWWYDIEETAVAPPPEPPAAPMGLAAVGRDKAVDLTWDPYTGADKLTIKMGTSQGTHPFGVFLMPDASSYTWPGLANDETFWFAATATVGALESAESEEVSAIPGLYGVVLPFVGQTQLGSPRFFDAWMGMRITTGPNNLTLRALGRWFDAGATGTHDMRIAAAGDPMNPLATVTVERTTPGAVAEFVYANLSSTIPLLANTVYFVVSRETSTGDSFHDSDFTRVSVLDANAGVDARAAFGDDAGTYTVDPVPGAAYGPVNLLYTRP
jgi:hypothetical protein